MKKILGFFFQITALVTLGYSFLNSSLVLVADWLSPLLSGQVYSFFTLLYLVAADPIRYPEVFVVWALSSVIMGVFIRKRVGSVLSVLSTWFFVVSLSAVLLFGIVLQVQENIILEESMDPFDVMPPFPDGLTITTLQEAPIIGEIYRFALDLMGEQIDELEPSTVLRQFADLFTFSIISKPLISAVFSLLGVELGKRLEHLFEPTITAKRLMLKERLVPEGKIIVVLIVLMSLITTPVSAQSSDLYTENFVTLVNEDGQVFVAGVFAGTNLEGLDREVFSLDGFMGCVVAAHQDILDVAYEYMETPEKVDFSEMLNLLPEAVVVFLYLDVEPEEAMIHSNMVALELSSFYEMEISELFSFSQLINDEGFSHTVTVNIFQSPLSLEEFNTRYLQHYQEYGGYIESISGDQLIPGKVDDSVDGSLLFTGYINTASIIMLVPVDPTMIPEMESDVVCFAGFVGYWDNSARILVDSLCIEEVFNLDDDPEYSGASDFSSSIIIAPGIDGESTNTLMMSTSVSLPFGLQEMIEEELVKMGVSVDLGGYGSEVQMKIELDGYTQPLDLRVTREASYDADTLNVKIMIMNHDTFSAYQVVVDDTASFERYQSLAPDGNFVQRYATIDPGEFKVYEYSVDIENPGSYTMTPVTLCYMNMDRVFETESNPTSFQVKRPSSVENLGNTFSSLLDRDKEISQYLPSNVSTALQISTYGVIFYTIADSIRKLRTWILS